MYHAVKMVLILQMGFIKSNQQKIIKITGFLLKLWNDGDLQFSLAGKLIAKKRLTGAVDVIFFGHVEPPVYFKEQVLLYGDFKIEKIAPFFATKNLVFEYPAKQERKITAEPWWARRNVFIPRRAFLVVVNVAASGLLELCVQELF